MAKKKKRITKKLLRALRANIKKARKKWKSMPKTARKKAMPSWSLARKRRAKAKR